MSADYYEFQEYLKLSVLAHDKIRVVTPVIFCTHVPNLEKRFSAEEKRFSNSVPLQNELKKLGLAQSGWNKSGLSGLSGYSGAIGDAFLAAFWAAFRLA